MRPLFAGAAVAAVLGLTTGAVLRPELTLQRGSTEMVANPQPVFEDSAMAGYSGPVPDYVIGVDWLPRNDAAIARALAEAALPAPEPAYDPPSIRYERTEFDADAKEPAAYPSERGDILGGLHAQAPSPSDDDSAPAPDA